jgi:hypothetical protein
MTGVGGSRSRWLSGARHPFSARQTLVRATVRHSARQVRTRIEAFMHRAREYARSKGAKAKTGAGRR